MDRREFIKLSCALGGLTTIVAGLESCTKTTISPTPVTNPSPTGNFTLDLTQPANAALNKVGGVVYQNNIAIICTAPSSYVALSQICTHQGCSLTYQAGANQMYCGCHGGTFDINGLVVAGPPPSSLTKYKTSLNGNILTVS